MTCPALDNDDKLDPISFVQSPPPLLMEMCVSEVITNRVKQAEAVSRTRKFLKEKIAWFSFIP